MNEPELTHLIEQHPDRGDMPVACIKAICRVESGPNFDEWAYRYEPGSHWRFGDDAALTPTERAGQMISWGLMQIMGWRAREHGFTSVSFPQLCDPATGMKFGMLHLKKWFDQYGNWQDAIASYNAGKPRLGPDGHYLNDSYVKNVLQHWAQYERQAQV